MESEQKSEQKDILVGQLMSMGYELEPVEKAYKQSTNKTIEEIQSILDNPQAQQEKQPDTESISGMVNQQLCKELMEMGFSKTVSEKAVFMSQNKSIQMAMDYIEKHRDDADFEEELRIVKMEEKPQLSEQEKKEKLLELQKKAKIRREEKEKEQNIETEKNRIKFNREVQMAKQQQEELQIKLQIEQQRKQKQADEEYKQQLLIKMEIERCERLGIQYVPKQKQVVNKNSDELIRVNIGQIKTAHPQNLFPDMAKNCFNTLKLYLENIVNNPVEHKFRKINPLNKRFQSQVASTIAGRQILENLGFKEVQRELLLPDGYDLELVKKTLEMIKKES